MKIKFIRRKGCCEIGYVGEYPIDLAKILIKENFAVECKDSIEKKSIKQTKKDK